MHGGSPLRTRFGPFELDHLNRLLSRDGKRIPLDPRALTCLEVLLLQPGALTTSAQLRRALWPDVHVGDGALRRVVNTLRKALGA